MAKSKKPGKSRKGRTAAITNARSFSPGSHEVDTWGKKNFEDTLGKLSSDELTGVVNYTASNYSAMNAHLRGYINGNISEANHKNIDSATAALDKARMPEAVVTHRGADAFGDFKDLSSIKLGSTFTDEGFGSTSPDPSKAWSSHSSSKIHFEIRVPKGAKAAYVDPISMHKGEKELLIQRNTTYKIISVDPANKRVVMQIVAQKKAKNPAPYTYVPPTPTP